MCKQSEISDLCRIFVKLSNVYTFCEFLRDSDEKREIVGVSLVIDKIRMNALESDNIEKIVEHCLICNDLWSNYKSAVEGCRFRMFRNHENL